jgi:hypothetical protein
MEFKYLRAEAPCATGWSRDVLTGVSGTSFTFEPRGVRCSLNKNLLFKGYEIEGVTGFTTATVEGATLDPALDWCVLSPPCMADPRTGVTLNDLYLLGKGIDAAKEVRFQMGGNILSISRAYTAAYHCFALFCSTDPVTVPIFSVPNHPPKIYVGYTAGTPAPIGMTAKFATGNVAGTCSRALIFSDGVIGTIKFGANGFAVKRGELAFPKVCCRWNVPVPLMPQTASALLSWVAANDVLMPCDCCSAPANILFAK